MSRQKTSIETWGPYDASAAANGMAEPVDSDLPSFIAPEPELIPAPTTIEELVELAKLQLETETELAAAEIEVARLKLKYKRISEDLIPTYFDTLGVDKLSIQGYQFEIKPDIFISVRSPDAYNYLAEKDMQGIIKCQVIVPFNPEEYDKANAFLEYVEETHEGASLKRDIHPQTLKAWGREQRRKGETIPDSFAVHDVKKAKITPVKTAAGKAKRNSK